MVIGIGSGSTARLAIDSLQGMNLSGVEYVSSSYDTLLYMERVGLKSVVDLNSVGGGVDVYFDGADVVDGDFGYLIKGGGGCAVQEKIIASAAKEFIVFVDDTKVTPRVNNNNNNNQHSCNDIINPPPASYGLYQSQFPIPVDVIPVGYRVVEQRLYGEFGASSVSLRAAGGGKLGPVVGDQGTFVLDVVFPADCGVDPRVLEGGIKGVAGVVECGVFCGGDAGVGWPRVYVGGSGGGVEVMDWSGA
eukprot:Nk52_evm1s42 gene=Nk52_evmTU1s42